VGQEFGRGLRGRLGRKPPRGDFHLDGMDSSGCLPLAHRRAMNTGGNEARRIEGPCRSASDLTAVLGGELHCIRIATTVAMQGAAEQGRVRDGLGAPAPFAAASIRKRG